MILAGGARGSCPRSKHSMIDIYPADLLVAHFPLVELSTIALKQLQQPGHISLAQVFPTVDQMVRNVTDNP
jgi:hypothetical protein